MSRRLGAVVAAAVLVSTATLAAQQSLRVIPLVRDGTVLISFSLADGYTDDVQGGHQERIEDDLHLYGRSPGGCAGMDRPDLASAVVSTSVQYDNLTRRHTVVRTIDGRVEEAQVVEDDADVRQLVTSINRLSLFRTVKLEANREYYIRVRAEVRPRNAAIPWPWARRPIGADQVHVHPLNVLRHSHPRVRCTSVFLSV